jgi:MFS family permease
MTISLSAMLLVCAGLYAVNHSAPWPAALRWLMICCIAGCVMVESVFTPAALALLADVVGDRAGRGTIMAFYSVLLSAGALVGAVIGGLVGRAWAVDGLIYATFGLALISMITVRTIPETTA